MAASRLIVNGQGRQMCVTDDGAVDRVRSGEEIGFDPRQPRPPNKRELQETRNSAFRALPSSDSYATPPADRASPRSVRKPGPPVVYVGDD